MPVDWLQAGGLSGFLLTLARVTAALSLIPLPGVRAAASPVRAILAVAIALVLAPVWPRQINAFPSIGGLVVLLLGEIAVGFLLGLVASVAIESLVLAAQVISLQAGYAYASTIDPASEADAGVLPVFAQLAGSVIFLSSGLDRPVFTALGRSLEVWPPGQTWASGPAAERLARLGAVLLEYGLRLALPIVALLLLTDLTLSLLARLNSQLPLLSVSFSVKMLAALLLMAWLIPTWPALLRAAAAASWQLLAPVASVAFRGPG